MNDCRGGDWPLVLPYILAAPVLLVAVAVAVAASRVAGMILRHDPAASLVERHPAEYAVVALTGRCTFGFLLVGLLLRRVM